MSQASSCRPASHGGSRRLPTGPVGGGIIAHPGADHWTALLGTVRLIAALLITDVVRVLGTRSSTWLTTSRILARKTVLESFAPAVPFMIGEAYPDSVPHGLSLFSLPFTSGFISPFWSALFTLFPTLVTLFLVLVPYFSPYNTVPALLAALPTAATATILALAFSLLTSPSASYIFLSPVALVLALPLLLAALADALAATRAQGLWNDVLTRRSAGRAARAVAAGGVGVVPVQSAGVGAEVSPAERREDNEEDDGEEVDESKEEREGLLSAPSALVNRAKHFIVHGKSRGAPKESSPSDIDALFACVDQPPLLRPLTDDPELLRAAAMVVDAAVSIFPGIGGVTGALTGHMRSLRAAARP